MVRLSSMRAKSPNGTAGRRVVGLAVIVLLLAACGSRGVPPNPSRPRPAPAPVSLPEYLLFTPPTVPRQGPVRLLIALHGYGDQAGDIAPAFVPVATENGWLLAAPTFKYGNWFDPAVVRAEDVALTRQLLAIIDSVRGQTGRVLLPKVYLVGFSRGAQLADRFALFQPERVAAVGSLSAGTYTLPEVTAGDDGLSADDPLPLPFGTADMQAWLGHGLDTQRLRQVRFWISVGGSDDNPNDIPRQWDPFLGRTRVTRAYTFAFALQALDVPARLTVYPGAQHQLTPDMAGDVSLFLSGL